MTTSPNAMPTTTRLGEILGEDCFQNGLYKHADSYGAGAPILRINDFDNDGRLLTREFNRVSVSANEYQQFAIREQDILVNRVNSLSHVGKSMLVPTMKEYPVFESNMMRVRIKADSQLVPEYVAVVLQGQNARRHFRKVAKPAVAQASINQEDVRSVSIALYPRPVQRRIAEAMAMWDSAIATAEQIVTKKEQFHRRLQKLLIDQRNARLHWETQELGSLLCERTERSTEHDEHPVLTSSRRGLFLQSEYFSKQVTSQDNTGYKVMRCGDFTFRSMSDDGRFVFNRLEKYESGIISPAYGVFYAEGVYPEFLVHYLNSSYFAQLLARETQGGTRKALRFSALAGMEVDLPKQADQERIAVILDESRREIGLFQTKLEKLRHQKRGLMQKLLTSQWRLPIQEEAN